MSNVILNNHRNLTVRINEHKICTPDNITQIPLYRTYDSVSYHVSRCNYCGKEWAEFWISYKYIFSSLINQHQHKHR